MAKVYTPAPSRAPLMSYVPPLAKFAACAASIVLFAIGFPKLVGILFGAP